MPVKFDDISKVASSVLNDDYQTSGHVFKAKQKTSYSGAVVSTQVDLFGAAGVATPAKLSWKLPKPFQLEGVTIDKLEMDKAGKFKLEASADKLYDGLKVECKSDLANVDKITVGCTYTGVKNAQIKLDCVKVGSPDVTGEVTYAQGDVTCGAKFVSSALLAGGLPDVGVRYQNGPAFCSLLAKEKFGTFNAHAHYKVNPDLQCAATYQHGGKGSGNFTVGAAYQGLYKVKFAQDQTLSCSAKYKLAKGFDILGGLAYNVAKGSHSYGVQVSIE